jgi:hypothetical protein
MRRGLYPCGHALNDGTNAPAAAAIRGAVQYHPAAGVIGPTVGFVDEAPIV